jgi:outer membrane immunogenic protein
MKKLVLALAATVAFAGSTMAADLGVRPLKAPPVAMALSWTGFYIFGGAGGGLWAADQHVQETATGNPLTIDQRQGGSGLYGTVGAGYDWQFNNTWVVGLFADGQFGSIKGTLQDTATAGGLTGTVKLENSWAVGARLGWVIAPNVLSYVNGGYSGAHWSGQTFLNTVTGQPTGVHTDGFNSNGWFIGGGVENNLDLFGLAAPGWFMKTEYRSTYFDRKTLDELDNTNALVGRSLRFNGWNQTISTSLVYRFN